MNTKSLKYAPDSGGLSTHTLYGGKHDERKKYHKVSPREEYILLALTDSELYGLQIAKAIKSASGGIHELRVGTLYPTLQKLEEKGLVTSRWGDERPEERCGARRRYYRLTDEGKATIQFLNSFKNKLLEWQPK